METHPCKCCERECDPDVSFTYDFNFWLCPKCFDLPAIPASDILQSYIERMEATVQGLQKQVKDLNYELKIERRKRAA